ncbi:transporter substrate-binding domain-containing protein [Pseudomonas sp. SL4(2022)]|uniref:substrate-binding periplasmic protein n=1 Tax=Pseudomonas sp. SL4(2022) TaxID=2994661 RepID=UPI00226DFD61|nr:transporter substrate-binding domain-containing protein [Pseudomonas sp. SL4(2022)]WAC43073.1 transporter substrate-binding domain-containing protein [Pseudomonas sp. SL4(2022)]
MRALCITVLLWLCLPVRAEQASLLVMTDVWPPFRMPAADGSLQGLDIDVLNQLSLRTGLHFNVQRAPWARGLAALENGKADLMTGLAKTPEREVYIHYLPQPYYACAPRFYAAPAQARALQSYIQLAALTIGHVLESVYFEPFDSDTQLRKVAVNNEEQLLAMLARGRLQALIGTDCQVDYELRDPRWQGRIVKAGFRPDARTDLYIGFSRQRNLQAQYQQINQTLVQLQAEGWISKAALRYQVSQP